MREILLKDGESCVSYHEYAVFSPPDGSPDSEPRSPSIMSEGEEGLRMFRDAVRNGHGLDNEGNFTANPKGKRSLQGRVRQVIARRRICHGMVDGIGNVFDGLDLTIDDYKTLGLHPATMPGLTRVTSESSFWDAKKDTFFVILEGRVDAVTGTTGQANAEAYKTQCGEEPFAVAHLKPLKRLSSLKEFVEEKEAHDVLKGSIQLLDTLRWMERVVKLLMQLGDELEARTNDLSAKTVPEGRPKESDDDDAANPSFYWHEIRQYLDCIWRLCTSLETDRRMSELRCRAQIDIIYSKMAQEDNNLNARMAVASTRDSSSMKALAVITAIFLPGEYIGTLFGVSMFNWQKGTAGDPASGKDAADHLPSPTIMPSFWIYWAFTIPLTLFILSGWRGWWVNQDRFFRRHLSNELSNERYWTVDGKPRDLETTFTQDFFSLFSLSGARSTTNRIIIGNRDKTKADPDDHHGQGLGTGPLKQGYPLGQTASIGRDREWMSNVEGRMAISPRLRQISFMAEPRQKQGVSAV
ncbi:hypothetical protein NUW58_g3236 [Xylaria curta]|uniref:Uncharacterized protein n=1 Tax=Xylaria curta TaxID=42375 RepID=A0ACC1PBV5_9PEZI|nr:hypothetical protein NUW58_g3236 [Xylaria curta]